MYVDLGFALEPRAPLDLLELLFEWWPLLLVVSPQPLLLLLVCSALETSLLWPTVTWLTLLLESPALPLLLLLLPLLLLLLLDSPAVAPPLELSLSLGFNMRVRLLAFDDDADMGEARLLAALPDEPDESDEGAAVALSESWRANFLWKCAWRTCSFLTSSTLTY